MGDLGESGSRIFVGASLSRRRPGTDSIFGPCLAGYSWRDLFNKSTRLDAMSVSGHPLICLCLVDPC